MVLNLVVFGLVCGLILGTEFGNTTGKYEKLFRENKFGSLKFCIKITFSAMRLIYEGEFQYTH